MKKNKILIAGGSGFIGYHLAKACLKKKWEVTSISTKYPLKNRKLKNVKYLICNIVKKKNLKVLEKIKYDFVINLAGYVDHSNKKKTLKSHYYGCKNLAEFFLKKKIKRFIQIGSSIEYGKIKSPQREDKFTNKKIHSVYGYSKLLSTKYLLKLHKNNNFPSTVLRLYLVYGPYQDINRIIPITIYNCLKNRTFDCSSGTQFRDFLYIDDLISAIFKILKTKKTIGEIFNIGYGKPTQIKKLINKIHTLINRGQPNFGKIKLRKDEIKLLFPSISKIKSYIRWYPKTNLRVGLKKTIKYYKNAI